MIDTAALVLEGGGMRGLYTAGVLDVLLRNDIRFSYCVGVSAGACNMVSYISGQEGRNFHVNVDYITDKRYLSMGNLVFHGSIFGMDMLFDTIPNKLVPFDFEAFRAYEGRALVGTTDCVTGEPVFFDEQDLGGPCGFLHLQASSSLPLLAKPVHTDGKVLMDGGISAPIPIQRALDDGFDKLVVILTQPEGYRKSPSSSTRLIRLKYAKKYPGLVKAMEERHDVYNNELDLVSQLEKQGRAFVLRPTKSLAVDRLEKDQAKLKALYDLGVCDTQAQLEALKTFLQ